MNQKMIFMIVVAIVLGMLLANMLKDVCGCKNLIEGQCNMQAAGREVSSYWVRQQNENPDSIWNKFSACDLKASARSRARQCQTQIRSALGGSNQSNYDEIVMGRRSARVAGWTMDLSERADGGACGFCAGGMRYDGWCQSCCEYIIPQCTTPSSPPPPGYIVNEIDTGLLNFDVSYRCGFGYGDSVTAEGINTYNARQCNEHNQPYTLGNECTEQFCTKPTDTTGYNIQNTRQDISRPNFLADIGQITCASGYKSTGGGPRASVCSSGGQPYTLSGCEPETCMNPTDEKYVVNSGSRNRPDFNLDVSCASGYKSTGGGPEATVCSSDDEPYTLSGCTEQLCNKPTDTTGYNIPDGSIPLPNFPLDVGQITCADGYTSTGNGPAATVCSGDGEAYTLSGCELTPPAPSLNEQGCIV